MTTGLRQLQKACRDFPDRLDAALADAVTDEAKAIVADERSRSPVVTGQLQAAWDWVQLDTLHATVGIFDPAVYYAIWIEWGRKGAAAQPIATPAAALARPRWLRRVRTTIKAVTDAAQ